MGEFARLRHNDREAPTIRPTPPLAVTFAAQRAVQPDIRRDDPVVVHHPLPPRVCVPGQPLQVSGLPRQHICVEHQARRPHVERMVARYVVVILEVVQHLLVGALAVEQHKAMLDLDGVARPVERRCLAQHRPATPVVHAADDPVLRVIVGRTGVVTHVKTRIATHPFLEVRSIRVGQPHQVEHRHRFAIVQPIADGRELLVIHPIACKWHIVGFGLGVLAQMSFPRQPAHVDQAIVAAQRVQHRPFRQVLDGVVRPVVAAPARHTLQIAALVKIVGKELPAGVAIGAQQFTLQQRPSRRRERRFHPQRRPAHSCYLHPILLCSCATPLRRRAHRVYTTSGIASNRRPASCSVSTRLGKAKRTLPSPRLGSV